VSRAPKPKSATRERDVSATRERDESVERERDASTIRERDASATERATLLVALAAALIAGAALAWLHHRSQFQTYAQSFDTMIYGRALWGVAHGQPENTVLGVHWLAVHGTFVLYLLAPLARVFEPVAVLIAAQAIALAATVGMVVFHAARGHRHAVSVALAVAFALTWGSPLVLNPFLFDVRPDVIGVPLCVAGLLRIHARTSVDAWAAALLFASLAAREEFSMVIAPALTLLPVDRSRGLGTRARWSLAAAAVAYTALYFVVGRGLAGGAETVTRAQAITAAMIGMPTWASLSDKPEILLVTLTAAGGLVLLGWRWSVPAWPGLIFLFAITRMSDFVLNAHYAMFAIPGLCTAAVAGAQRLRTFTPGRRRAAWTAVVLLSAFSGFLSSSAPGGGRFLARHFDLGAAPGKAGTLARSPAIVASRALLERIPDDAGLVVPYALSASLVDRAVVWESHRFRRHLAGGGPFPDEIRWAVVMDDAWPDVGKTLVQAHGFRLVDAAHGWLALLTRDDVDDAAAMRATTPAPAECVSLARWPAAGLSLCTLERRADGRLGAVLVRDSAPAPDVSGRTLCVIAGGASQPLELTLLEGLVNPRDIPVGRAASMLGPPVPPAATLVVHLAARDDSGQWIVLPAEGSAPVTLR